MNPGLRYLAVTILLFGGIWPLTKLAYAHATPLWFATNRAGMAAGVAALLLAALGRLRLPGRADLPCVLSVGLMQIGGFFALSHLALAWVPAGRTAILSNITVFWLIPLSMLVLGERVSPRQWLAVGIGVGGVLVLMQPWAAPAGAALGYAMLLGASLLWSLAILVTRRLPPRRPVLELMPFVFGLATLLLLPLALWREPAGGIGGPAWPAAIYVGAFAGPVGTWATIEAGRRLSGVVASLGFLVVPALGLLLSNLLLGEALTWDVWLGGGLIGASVLLAARG